MGTGQKKIHVTWRKEKCTQTHFVPEIPSCYLMPFVFFAFCYCDKLLTKTILGREEFVSSHSLQSTIEERPSRNSRQKPQQNAVYRLVPSDLLNCFSYSAQAHLPSDGMGSTLQNQLAIKKVSIDVPISQYG